MKIPLSIKLCRSNYSAIPFPLIHSPAVLNPELSIDLLNWLESFNSWDLVQADFYEQYEFNFQDVNIPARIRCFNDGTFALSVQTIMSEIFEVEMEDGVDVVAHKLIPGQKIGIHNDNLEAAETHRLIIQLNSGWEEDHGGYFMTFRSDDARDIHQILAPIHNSAVGFAITEKSHHAVSTVYKANRYTIVCSLKAKSWTPA